MHGVRASPAEGRFVTFELLLKVGAGSWPGCSHSLFRAETGASTPAREIQTAVRGALTLFRLSSALYASWQRIHEASPAAVLSTGQPSCKSSRTSSPHFRITPKPVMLDGSQVTYMLSHPSIDGGIALESAVEPQQFRFHRRDFGISGGCSLTAF
jgi:hypothetical protein